MKTGNEGSIDFGLLLFFCLFHVFHDFMFSC